jgi:hypothetical protein
MMEDPGVMFINVFLCGGWDTTVVEDNYIRYKVLGNVKGPHPGSFIVRVTNRTKHKYI